MCPGWPRKASRDRKSTRLNSSHSQISYAVFCLKKKAVGVTGSAREEFAVVRGRGDRLRVPLERHREVTVGFGVSRIEGEAPLDLLDLAPVLSATHQHHTEIVPRRGIRRVERHCALQQLFGPGERTEHDRLPCTLTQLGGAKGLGAFGGR